MILPEPKYTVTQNNPYGAPRYYEDSDGVLYPSLTNVLSAVPNPWLEKWKEDVGEEEAGRIAKEAAEKGSALHEAIERHFLSEEPISEDADTLKRFKPLYALFLKHIEPLLIEMPLASKTIGIAGTTDCIGYYKGKLSVIDFKTSRKEKKKEWIESYFAQCTGYALMFKEMYDIRVEQIVIGISVEGEAFPQIFVEGPLAGKDYLIEALRYHRGEK